MLSLIQTSQNRREELMRFVSSLNAQRNIDFKDIQLIFVDQGSLRDVFNVLCPDIDFKYVKTKFCSLSHARNIGLEYVKGEYIGFPDDDCWYEPGTIKKVLEAFSEGNQGVIAKGTDEKGNMTNDFPSGKQKITMYNHCGAISYTIFLKYVPSLKFDENIGVGSPFKLSSGEETDYLLQSMCQLGTNMLYNPEIIVHHPNSLAGNFVDNEVKQYEYARGWGYVLKKHHYPKSMIVRCFLRPLCGMIYWMLRLDFLRVKHSYYLFKGRLEGFLFLSNYGKS